MNSRHCLFRAATVSSAITLLYLSACSKQARSTSEHRVPATPHPALEEFRRFIVGNWKGDMRYFSFNNDNTYSAKAKVTFGFSWTAFSGRWKNVGATAIDLTIDRSENERAIPLTSASQILTFGVRRVGEKEAVFSKDDSTFSMRRD